MRGAQLQGANLLNAEIWRANLEGARWDEETKVRHERQIRAKNVDPEWLAHALKNEGREDTEH